MARKKTDAFIAVRPKSEQVAVGDDVYTITSATLDQEARFLAVVDSLDLGDLIGPVTALLSSDDGLSTTNFLPRLKENGAAIWKSARVVLGKQFAPAIKEASIAMLDTETNFKMLVASGVAQPDDAERGRDGEFLGCSVTRREIKTKLTLLQGMSVIKTSWTINGYGKILGNLLTMDEVA